MGGPFVDVVDVRGELSPPTVPEISLDEFPKDWQEWESTFDTVRDVINKLLSIASKLPGVDIPTLPDGTLTELVVMPFTGRFDLIAGNADACTKMAKGMRGVSKNIGVATVDMQAHWDGRAAMAFTVQAGTYATVTAGASYLVRSCSHVFSTLAEVSRSLAQAATRLIVVIGEAVARLASNIVRKFGGWWSVACTIKDIIEDGIEPIREIYDDIVLLKDAVAALLDLVPAVKAYFEAMAEEIKHLAQLKDLLQHLPHLADAPLGTLLRTKGEYDSWEEERRALERRTRKQDARLRHDLRDLGYDPDAAGSGYEQDGVEDAVDEVNAL